MNIPDEAIKNDNGDVFLKWALEHRNLDPMQKNHIKKLIDDSSVDRFVYNWNIAGAFVTLKEAEKLLTVKLKICNCSNGIYKSAFIFASKLDFCLWSTGERCK